MPRCTPLPTKGADYEPFTVFQKKEYDIILTNGQRISNCYPNGNEVLQLVDPGWIIEVEKVAYIRLAANPVTGVNNLYQIRS